MKFIPCEYLVSASCPGIVCSQKNTFQKLDFSCPQDEYNSRSYFIHWYHDEGIALLNHCDQKSSYCYNLLVNAFTPFHLRTGTDSVIEMFYFLNMKQQARPRNLRTLNVIYHSHTHQKNMENYHSHTPKKKWRTDQKSGLSMQLCYVGICIKCMTLCLCCSVNETLILLGFYAAQ